MKSAPVFRVLSKGRGLRLKIGNPKQSVLAFSSWDFTYLKHPLDKPATLYFLTSLSYSPALQPAVPKPGPDQRTWWFYHEMNHQPSTAALCHASFFFFKRKRTKSFYPSLCPPKISFHKHSWNFAYFKWCKESFLNPWSHFPEV